METVAPDPYLPLVDSLVVQQSVESSKHKKLREEVDSLVGHLLKCLRAEHDEVLTLVEQIVNYQLWLNRTEETPLRTRLNGAVRMMSAIKKLRNRTEKLDELDEVQKQTNELRLELAKIIALLSLPELVDPKADITQVYKAFVSDVDELVEGDLVVGICDDSEVRKKAIGSVNKLKTIRLELEETTRQLATIQDVLYPLIIDDLVRVARGSLIKAGFQDDDDTVGEVILKVVSKLRKDATGFRAMKGLCAYVKTIVKNDAIHEAQERDREAELTPESTPDTTEDSDWDAIMYGELLHKHLEEVQEPHRTLFIKRILEKMPIPQVLQEFPEETDTTLKNKVNFVKRFLKGRHEADRKRFS